MRKTTARVLLASVLVAALAAPAAAQQDDWDVVDVDALNGLTATVSDAIDVLVSPETVDFLPLPLEL